MGTLWITELTSGSADGLHRLPAIANQAISIGATSARSVPFGDGTRAVRICSDTDCCIAIGNVASETDMPLAAGRPESFAVNPHDRIAVIGRAMQENQSDPFAIFTVVSDPKATKQRLQDLKAASDELRELRAEAAAAQKRLADEQEAASQAQADARARHDAELKTERDAFNAERLREENALRAREKRVAETESRLAAEAAANAALKENLEQRLAHIRAATAA